MPSGYESPRVPPFEETFFGDSAPNNQEARGEGPRVRFPQASACSREGEAPTKGGLPEDHRTAVTSSIVLTTEGSLTKRMERGPSGK